MFFLGVPTNIFRHKIHLWCDLLQSHIWELEDGRVSCAAFLLSSFLFISATPLASLALAQLVGYLILGWDFNTFVVQYLFGAIYLLVGLEFGCALGALFRGSYSRLAPIFSVYVFVSVVVSGLLVNPNKLSTELLWVVYLSYSFW